MFYENIDLQKITFFNQNNNFFESSIRLEDLELQFEASDLFSPFGINKDNNGKFSITFDINKNEKFKTFIVDLEHKLKEKILDGQPDLQFKHTYKFNPRFNSCLTKFSFKRKGNQILTRVLQDEKLVVPYILVKNVNVKSIQIIPKIWFYNNMCGISYMIQELRI